MILYQYRKIDKYTIKTLLNNELYFSFPSEFNDPFDCLGYTNCPKDKKSIEAFLNRMKNSDRMSEKQINEIKEMFEKVNYNSEIVKQYFPSESNDIFRNKMIVKCFTSKNDSILMWSHYAQNHKGICLGLEVSQYSQDPSLYLLELDKINIYNGKPTKFLPIDKISYPVSDEIPEFNPFETVKQINYLTTKHKDWQYEQEYRCIMPYESLNTQYVNFKKENLKEIIFGIESSSKDIENIKQILDTYYPNIDCLKAKRVIGKYEIAFDNF